MLDLKIIPLLKKLVLLILSMSMTVFCVAQDSQEIARLKEKVNATNDAMDKIMLLDTLFMKFQYSNYDSAYHYVQRMMDIAYRIKRKSSISVGHTNLGHIYKNRGQYDSSIVHHLWAAHWNRLDTFPQGEAVAYANIANVHQLKGDYDSAIVYMRKAETVFTSTDIRDDYLRALYQIKQNLANIYIRIGWYDNALEELESVGEWFEDQQLDGSVAYVNLLKGEANLMKGDYNSAEPLLQKAVGFYRDTPTRRTFYIRSLLVNARLLYEKEQIDGAQSLVDTVLHNVEYISSAYDSTHIALLEGKLSLHQKYYQQALEKFQLAEKLSQQTNLNPLRTECYRLLAETYEATNNKSLALDYLKKYINLSDSVSSVEKIRLIRDMEGRFHLAQRDHQILVEKEKIKAEKSKTLLILLIAIIVIIISVISYIRYRQKQALSKRLQSTLAERELLIKEIHHRVKNNLQIVSSLLSVQKKQVHKLTPEEIINQSQNRIYTMAMIHERLYQSENLEEISIQEYFADICSYYENAYSLDELGIDIEQQIDCPNIDIDQLIPIGLVMNELILNSIKHAFDGKPGTITISAVVENEKIEFTFADNGKGLPEDYEQKARSSLGMQLIKGLIQQIRATMEVKNVRGAVFVFRLA